jgi:GntR family transcriptional regulator
MDVGRSTIERSAPLYHQVEEDLRRRIYEGEYGPGARLPSDSEFCAFYGVSRLTVRRAVDELVRRHLIYRRQGIGTFVVVPEEAVKAVTLTGYIDDVLPLNDHKLLCSGHTPVPDSLALLMKLPLGSTCRSFTTLNRLDGKPLTFATFYFPDDLAQHIRKRDFASRTPPIRLIETRSGRWVKYAEQSIDAVGAPEQVIAHFDIDLGTPVMRIERVYFDAEERPLEAVVAHYHPARYRFTVRLLPQARVTEKTIRIPKAR